MFVFYHLSVTLAWGTDSRDCMGPFPGWLSGPSMQHNDLAPLPTGDNYVLCCHGKKGAFPQDDNGNKVVKIVALPNMQHPVVGFYFGPLLSPCSFFKIVVMRKKNIFLRKVV